MKSILKNLAFGATVLAMTATLATGPASFAAFAQGVPQPTSADISETTIKALQEALNKQGIAVKVDGVLDDETRAALRTYQSQHHLPVTGVPDRATLDKLGVAAGRSDRPAATAPGQAMDTPGMMGPGMMGPGMMGPGMMGPGMMQMMPGMMSGQAQSDVGPGQMPMMCPMMTGMMPMGPTRMGQGIGPGTIYGMSRAGSAPASAEQVGTTLKNMLAWHGNPRLKLGELRPTDTGEIVAEIVTQEGSLVQRLAVDRRTGMIRQID